MGDGTNHLLALLDTFALQMERRERLKKVLAEREAAGEMVDGAPLVGQVVMEEVAVQKELFYTEGAEDLKEARNNLADWSLKRAAGRLRAAQQQRRDLEALRVSWEGVW